VAGHIVAPGPVAVRRPDALRVAVIDDPERAFHLVGVHGLVTSTTIGALAERLSEISPRSSVHVDLASATIVDRRAMDALERVVDALERRGVHLRLVGLDPAHPALSAN
jgi:anti-anti-sigma regulatory factor